MSDTIQQNSVVTFHYKLKDETGNVIEEASADHPVTVLQGHGNIVRGLHARYQTRFLGQVLL